MGEWSYNFILPSPSYLRSSFEGLIRMRCQQLLLVRAVVLSWILPCSLLPIRSSPSKESRKKKVSIYSKWYFLYFSIFGGGAVSYVWILPKLPIFLKMVRTTVSVEGSTFLSLISRSVGIAPVVPSSSVIPPHAPSSWLQRTACISRECFGHSWRVVCVCFPTPVRSTAWFTQGILPLISAGYLRACLPSTWHHSQPRLGRCSGVLGEGANEQRDGVSTKPYFGFLSYNCMHIPLADVRPAVNMVSILSLFSFWLLLFRNS